MRRIALAFLSIGLVHAMGLGPAAAQVTQMDLLVAGRAIGFIDSLTHGDLHVGIVYDPSVALSQQQANEIAKLMGDGMRIGSMNLMPVMVPIGKIDHGGIDVYFLTEGVGSAAVRVAHASHQRKVPCVTFDLNQVRNGSCTMGVRTHPKIEVIVNRAEAQASGTEMATVFRVMITEI